jgi:hypothetical protein
MARAAQRKPRDGAPDVAPAPLVIMPDQPLTDAQVMIGYAAERLALAINAEMAARRRPRDEAARKLAQEHRWAGEHLAQLAIYHLEREATAKALEIRRRERAERTTRKAVAN